MSQTAKAAKLRVAWFASSKPGTMSSYVSALYHPQLNEFFDVTYFVGDAESGGTPFGVAYELNRSNPFDSFVYCLERNGSSDFAWATLGVHPGIVLLMEDFAPPEKPWLFQSSYDELSSFLNDASTRDETKMLLDNFAPSLVDKEPYPVDAEIRAAMLATTIIVASEEMLERIPQKFHRKCSVIPMPVEAPDYEMTEVLAHKRAQLRVAVCSPVNEDYLVSKIFLALKNYNGAVELSWLVGDISEEATLLRKQTEYLPGSEITLSVSARSISAWQDLVRKSDVALHLQGWGRASLEPYLGTSLMTGMPTVVSNFGSGRLLPEDLAIKIPIGLAAAHSLTGVLQELSELSNGSKEISPWDYSQHRQMASVRYKLSQNVGELAEVIRKDALTEAAKISTLGVVRTMYRQAWIEAAEKAIGEFEIGESFSPAKQFLKSLI